MVSLRNAKYATRSTNEFARKDGALFRPTTSGPGEPRQRAEAWALDDRRHRTAMRNAARTGNPLWSDRPLGTAGLD
jgi:hypothetical protein